MFRRSWLPTWETYPLNDLSAFAMPPLPEPVDSYEELETLCDQRADDLVFATSMFSFDLPRMMESITEAVSAYSELCNQRFGQEVTPGGELQQQLNEAASEEDRSFDVNEVIFSLMSEADKLAELAKLLRQPAVCGGGRRFGRRRRGLGRGQYAGPPSP